MKISARTRYAIRILVELGTDMSRVHSLREVEAGQQISAKFAKQILQPLESRSLITSRRGARGGYRLKIDPNQVSLLDVFKITGEPLLTAPCVNDLEYCPRNHGCGARSHWQALDKLIRDYLEQTTIADLIRAEKRDSVVPDS
ncbi:MAG TPA: Rrf2 family transcriptional regulator [Candidatus Aminicenantes bacterium]|nr:Rrf2 family transcriptional regulator [Candidatus Aminicenantes bacterium]